MQIKDFFSNEGKDVSVKGWVANKRTGKGLVFIILRDGTGFSQCVVNAENVEDEVFEEARNLTMESSVELYGKVVQDERQVGGYELHVETHPCSWRIWAVIMYKIVCESYEQSHKHHMKSM